MAKTSEMRETNRNAGRGTATAETIPDLSAKVEKAIEAIKADFNGYVKQFTSLAARREELAPKFMKAFGLWQAETGGTFVAFVRHIDPSIGMAKKEYNNHRTYMAADYLRRMVGNAAKRAGGGPDGSRADGNSADDGNNQPRAATPGDAFTRLLASFISLLPERQVENLKEAFKAEFNWDDARITKTLEQAEQVDPLVEIKGRSLENLRLTLPAHEEAAT